MLSLNALLLLTAISAPGDAVLVEFTAPWCGACQQVAPIVERLASDGYPIRKVDIDADRAAARQYGITAVPTFVLLVDGREVDRVVGPASYDHFTQMFASLSATRREETARNESQASASPTAIAVRGQSPDADPWQGQRRLGATRPERLSETRDARIDDSQFGGPTQGPGAYVPTELRESRGEDTPVRSPIRPDDLARQATVRLTVEDATGFSHGTGTIIDTHGDEALVLTCGHIFRDSKGKGRITVEPFAPGAKGPVAGHLISYDADKLDIGLVSIRPGCAVTPAPVGARGIAPQVDDRVFSIGCDHGGEPRVAYSRVTGIDRYVGPPNYEVAGQPVQGRSGGGLFAADGRLIGVCNAADQADNEGIYAALPSIHQQLVAIGQQRLFERGDSRMAAADARLLADDARRSAPNRGIEYPPDRSLSGAPRSTPAPVMADSYAEGTHTAPRQEASIQAAQIVVVVRPGQSADGQQEVYWLDNLSPELLEQIRREGRRQQDLASRDSRPADSRLAGSDRQRELPPEFRPLTSDRSERDARSPVVRAQSSD
jgi:thiol-disulfide isomerase/thioredoxin